MYRSFLFEDVHDFVSIFVLILLCLEVIGFSLSLCGSSNESRARERLRQNQMFGFDD
jgi:hypothetical protein